MIPVADALIGLSVPTGQNVPKDHILLILVVKGVGLQSLVLHVELGIVAVLVGQTVHAVGEECVAEEFDLDLFHILVFLSGSVCTIVARMRYFVHNGRGKCV